MNNERETNLGYKCMKCEQCKMQKQAVVHEKWQFAMEINIPKNPCYANKPISKDISSLSQTHHMICTY